MMCLGQHIFKPGLAMRCSALAPGLASAEAVWLGLEQLQHSMLQRCCSMKQHHATNMLSCACSCGVQQGTCVGV